MDLQKLKEGWDGYNGKPINENIIKIVESLDLKDWKVYPVPNGNLQLEKGEVEIEIFEDHAFLVKKIKIDDIKDYL